MADYTTQLNNSAELFTDYDNSKFLLGFNSFTNGTITASGADVDITIGEIFGQIASTGKIVPMSSAAADGSQYPYGVAIAAQKVVNGASAVITLVNKGRVDSGKLGFQNSDTLDTAVGALGTAVDATFNEKRTYRALLNDLGLELCDSDELTKVDNS